jgi:hypothetical protein
MKPKPRQTGKTNDHLTNKNGAENFLRADRFSENV